MAFSADDITALKTALASGVSRVRFEDGRETTYRSLAEMREIIRMAEQDVGAPASIRKHSVAGF